MYNTHLISFPSVADIPIDTQALTLLTSLVSSGTATSPTKPAFLPPPQHLALVATLTVHPSLTTRAKTPEALQAASLALRYLRLVLKLVGPVNAGLHEAFVFIGIGTSSRRGGRRRTGEDVSPVSDEVDNVNSELANASGLWARAEDFWQVVGWVLNCSIAHKRMWDKWNCWLEYMIDVLERDWETRTAEDLEGGEKKGRRQESIIISYLNAGSAATGRERRIMRAVFADGSARSMQEFPEIWRDEVRELRKDTGIKNIDKKINIDVDNYGDYLDEEHESDLEDLPTASLSANLAGRRSSSTTKLVPNCADALGGIESLALRLRLLSLLSHVCATLPEAFTSVDHLYDLYLENIRPLPLPIFFFILAPSSLRLFTTAAASSLTQYILRSIIASSAPLPINDSLAQETLERCYLPFAANTNSIDDNAKVSICVETLLRIFAMYGELVWSPELQIAAEMGIEAREGKAKRVGKGKGGDAEEERMWLKGSAERIRETVDMARD